MSFKNNLWMVFGLAIPLTIGSIFIGCMKSDPNANSINSSINDLGGGTGLDASHGGAHIVLPEIDPTTLNKQGTNSGGKDSLILAWFELTISGEKMSDMFFQFPLGKKGGSGFDIKAIPAGKSRSFHGRLLSRDRQLTHEGTTVADIRGGEYSDIHLYLAKAMGSANVCVVIEGQKPPACAVDTILPPPPPDSQIINHCWYVSSDSISGRLHLFDTVQNGYRGLLVSTLGAKLPVTNWYYSGDSLYVYMLSATKNKKWLYSGPIQASGNLWLGTGFSSPTFAYVPFYGKPISCIEDTVFVPPVDTVVVPPKDASTGGIIPRSTSSEGEVTRCFEMRMDYNDMCQTSAFAKMSFKGGQITGGYILVGDRPNRTYTQILGNYDEGKINIESVLPNSGMTIADSIMYNGIISSDRTMTKGDYIRLPMGKKGSWSMKTIACSNWTPTYPDSSCSVIKK